MHTENITERRKHQRFKARKNSFAALKPSHAVGEIIDIGKGGLAMRYGLDGAVFETPPEVMVIFTIDRFHSKEIPCKAVSDLEIKDSTLFSIIGMRRCGLQFGELTPEQESQLDVFLQSCTVGHA